MRALIYARVSTAEQEDSGLSLESQADHCRAAIGQREWTVTGEFSETVSTGKKISKRPKLAAALDALDAHEHDALVVRRLDRLCRSTLEFQLILERAQKHGWELLMLEPQVDTTTPFGRAMASMAATFAQLERELIGQRTREAMRVLRDRGLPVGGAPALTDQATLSLVASLKADGLSQHAIARELNDRGVATLKGGAWHQSTVRSILGRV